MPPAFCKADHGPRKLRTATLHGLVFASLSAETPSIEAYLGEEVLGRIRRVLRGPVRVLGRFTQALPNNWKLYVENVKDTYHASLLHAFFGTFRITRLTQGGGILVSPDGGHHASYTIDRPDDRTSTAYREQGIRSEKARYRLADPSLLDSVDEFGDGIQLQILTVFPGFVLQQITNCLAVRQVLPKGPGAMELHWTYLGFADDERHYTLAARMLSAMAQNEVRLLTNNPRKVEGLEAAGVRVAERVPLKAGSGRHNRAYLETKRARSGHQL
jgi:anthranilate 1,2-dioxygenase large subunit/terephthalate 1,2-dioxygenase oxygenase component alpha subunit